MEPENSLSHSQQPANCPSTEPDLPSSCPHPTSWIFILILSSNLYQALPSDLIPSGFLTKTMYAPLLSLSLLPQSSSFYCPNNIWWGIQIMEHLLLRLLRFLFCFVPLRPKYLHLKVLSEVFPRPMHFETVPPLLWRAAVCLRFIPNSHMTPDPWRTWS
jgi:hypothetical protein